MNKGIERRLISGETRPQWRSEVGTRCCDYTERRFLATLQTTGLLLGVAADSHRLHRGVEFRRCRSDYPPLPGASRSRKKAILGAATLRGVWRGTVQQERYSRIKTCLNSGAEGHALRSSYSLAMRS